MKAAVLYFSPGLYERSLGTYLRLFNIELKFRIRYSTLNLTRRKAIVSSTVLTGLEGHIDAFEATIFTLNIRLQREIVVQEAVQSQKFVTKFFFIL